MPNLEKYMQDHLGAFDTEEPSAGHFDRFESRLAASQPQTRPSWRERSRIMRIAAIILLLITVSVVAVEFLARNLRERMATPGQGTEMPLEVREALQYYDNRVNVQLAALGRMTAGRSEVASLNISAHKDIRDLDASTLELKEALASNPGNEQILDAIIRNQQMKESMLNTIITRLSEAAK